MILPLLDSVRLTDALAYYSMPWNPLLCEPCLHAACTLRFSQSSLALGVGAHTHSFMRYALEEPMGDILLGFRKLLLSAIPGSQDLDLDAQSQCK